MYSHSISTLEELRAIYPPPPENSMATRCVFLHLDRHHRTFIALSPFLTIASTNQDGMPDVSPRGDLPGFVAVPDAHTLVIPDRPGNKKLLTLANVLENPNVALIFLVPGRTESVRVNGRARITTDPALLAPLAVQGKVPLSGLLVAVELAWLHCGRALIRSRIWDTETQVAPDALPSLGQMLAEQIAGVEAAEAEARLEMANGVLLWGEPRERPRGTGSAPSPAS
jgi:PPOX class probable FMN-dependent enzyme